MIKSENHPVRLIGIIPSLLILIGFVFVLVFFSEVENQTKDRQLQGQTYARFNACILSFTPETRTQGDIDHCWSQAMKDTGKTVKRYNPTVE